MIRLLDLLVGLFPRRFRESYGDDLLLQLRRDRDRARAGGLGARIAFPLEAVIDLVSNAVAEHVNPTTPPRLQDRRSPTPLLERLDACRSDLSQASRRLSRTPVFTVTTVGTLALAIGVTVGSFAVVKAVVLDPLPYPEPDRLVHIAASAPGSDRAPEFGVSSEFYVEYRESADLLEDVGVHSEVTRTLRANGRVERVPMATASPSLFTTLGVAPALGRLPVEADGDGVALISHAAWVGWFGSDPEVVGQAHDISDRLRTVVGVMGPDFEFPARDVHAWISDPIRAEDVFPGRFGLSLIGRLAPGATLDGVVDQLSVLARRLPDRFGGSASYARLIEQHRPVVRRLDTQIAGPVSNTLWLLFGAASVILVIACANVTNLLLVRAESRSRDVAVRHALGAGRGRLVRSQIAEAALLAGGAGTLAAVVAGVGAPAAVRLAPTELPRLASASLGAGTLLPTLGVVIAVAIVCGWVPTLLASRPDLTLMRDGARGGSRGRGWWRDALVVAQTALALVLLIGSALLVRSLERLRRVDLGYDTRDVATFRVAPEGDFRNPGFFVDFHLSFMERVAALPGVRSVGVVQNPPLLSTPSDARFITPEMPGETDDAALLGYTWTAGEYFDAMGIELLLGRRFALEEQRTDLARAVVSESAAHRLWPGQDPVGRRLRRQDQPQAPWLTVVGVVGDVRQSDFRNEPQPTVYLPLIAGVIPSPSYVVKSERAEELGAEVRALVREIAPRAPLYSAFTMDRVAARSMARLSFTMSILVTAAGLALLLGVTGLYGVLAYLVSQRDREIGVRMALGAGAPQIRAMIVARGAAMATAGLGLGTVVALGATRSLEGLLFGVEAVDAPTYVAASGALLTAAPLASYLPARRASRVDPVESLRAE